MYIVVLFTFIVLWFPSREVCFSHLGDYSTIFMCPSVPRHEPLIVQRLNICPMSSRMFLSCELLQVLIIKPNRCTNFSNLFFGIKLYMFRTVPQSIIRSFSLYPQQWYMSYSLQAGSGRNWSSFLILFASCQQTCMSYTIAVCTVKNSWWWTQELSETCGVLFQK